MNKIKALEVAHAAATPGAWYTAAGSIRAMHKVQPYKADAHICCGMQSVAQDRVDATFIVLAHTMTPLFVKAVELLQDSLNAWEGEEDSVKEEHQALIDELNEFMGSLA